MCRGVRDGWRAPADAARGRNGKGTGVHVTQPGISGLGAPEHSYLELDGATADGLRDALTRYTTPVSGAYYFIPSVTVLAGFAPEAAD